MVNILTHIDIIYPSSYQDQDLTKFMNYSSKKQAKTAKKAKNTVFKCCSLNKIANSCVLTADRILSFKIEFVKDCTCVIQAFSPKMKDIGYFYVVPSKKYVYRISPSLYFDLQGHEYI